MTKWKIIVHTNFSPLTPRIAASPTGVSSAWLRPNIVGEGLCTWSRCYVRRFPRSRVSTFWSSTQREPVKELQPWPRLQLADVLMNDAVDFFTSTLHASVLSSLLALSLSWASKYLPPSREAWLTQPTDSNSGHWMLCTDDKESPVHVSFALFL